MVRKIVTSVLGLAVLATGVGAASSATPVATPPVSDVAVVGEALLGGPSTFAKAAAAPIPGCADSTYALAKWKIAKPFEWSYN
jgi:hypothetical protein